MVALGSCAPAEPTCGHTGYGSLSHNIDSSGLPRDPATEADMNAQPEDVPLGTPTGKRTVNDAAAGPSSWGGPFVDLLER